MEKTEEKIKKYDLNQIELETLNKIIDYIKNSQEFNKLFKCTQMINDVVKEENPTRTTRGEHSRQVGVNSEKLARIYSGEEKTAKRSSVVGFSHDLGHTPMGHATEEVLSKEYQKEEIFKNIKTPKFNHAQMSGPIIARMFEKMFENNNVEELGFEIFSKDEIALIQNSKFIDYIVKGVQNHGVYLVSELNGDAKTDVALICGRLADTLSYMPTDLYDLLHTIRKDGEFEKQGQTIITENDLKSLAYEGKIRKGFTSNEPNQKIGLTKTFGEFIVSQKGEKEGKEFVQNIIDQLLAENQEGIYELQATMAVEAMQFSKQRNVLPETISDDLKLLRSAEFELRDKNEKWTNIQSIPWGVQEIVKKYPKTFGLRGDLAKLESNVQNKYIEYILKGKSFSDTFVRNGKKICFQDILQGKTDKLRRNCPTLAFIYELQDELSYNQALQAQKESDVLGNEEQINGEIISEQYYKFKEKYEQGLSKQDNIEFEQIYEKMIYCMQPFKQAPRTTQKEIKQLKTVAYATYKVQKMVNDDINQLRETQELLNDIENQTELEEVKENNENIEQNQEGNINSKNETLPVVYKPNRVKDFFHNLTDKIKKIPLFEKLRSNNKSEQTQDNRADIATEKMEAMKKDFDSRISVSEEEQEKNRIEYERRKQKVATISASREEDKGEKR